MNSGEVFPHERKGNFSTGWSKFPVFWPNPLANLSNFPHMMCYKPHTYIQSKTLALIASNFCKVLYTALLERKRYLCVLTFINGNGLVLLTGNFILIFLRLNSSQISLLLASPLPCIIPPKANAGNYIAFVFSSLFSLFSQNLNAMVNKWSRKVGALKCREILQFLQAVYLKITSECLCYHFAFRVILTA